MLRMVNANIQHISFSIHVEANTQKKVNTFISFQPHHHIRIFDKEFFFCRPFHWSQLEKDTPKVCVS